ncbi:hypothetical protein LSCM1_01554 [Leishmania martiniquensis]|uniref:Uncharacterized protein n=1 Tax=Leishmania martiniquensis TaxID=1580590 RepID=A0A836GTB0_9TRYP|nr:hypothetical protein LSCM1_01554 [Leishmania martiniquensis]
MQQFVVKKSSRIGEEVWTTRVLTVDAENHVLYLSKRNDASQTDHHCMVKIKEVEAFPAYSSVFHSVTYLPAETWRTMCIRGSTITRGDSSPITRMLQIGTRKMTPTEHSAFKVSMQKLSGEQEPLEDENLAAAAVVSNDEWTLRGMTTRDFKTLFKALRAAVTDPTCVKNPNLRHSSP